MMKKCNSLGIVIISNRHSGFTLVELIVTILLISILAAFMVPNLELDRYRETGFVQQSMSAIRHAQKQAIGSGCEVNVSIASSGCSLQWNGTPAGIGCLATSISNPATGLNNFCNNSTPESTADLPTTIRFDNIGRPIATVGDLSLNLGSKTITVEQETGFAHE